MEEQPEFLRLSKNLQQIDFNKINKMTNFPDYLESHDFEGPILGGVDVFGRHLITYKCYVIGDNEEELVMETIFQLRTKQGTFWTACGKGTENHLLWTTQGISEEQYSFYLDFFENQEAFIRENHKPCKKEWIGRKVILSSERGMD